MTKEQIFNTIQILKQQLKETDYQAIKYAEGVLSFTEYSDTLKQRQAWRDEINALELQLEEYKRKN